MHGALSAEHGHDHLVRPGMVEGGTDAIGGALGVWAPMKNAD